MKKYEMRYLQYAKVDHRGWKLEVAIFCMARN